jgi:hypothetical protein
VLPLILSLAFAQQPTGVAGQVFEMSGEVDRIDRAGRLITIRSAGTIQAPIYAGPDLPIFDELRSGDVVTIKYYDSILVEVTPGERMKPLENTTEEAKRNYTRPDASVMQQLKLVVTIDAIDRAKGMVTYHGFDNRRVVRAVINPSLLDNAKVGDVVTITYTRAQAVGITKTP